LSLVDIHCPCFFALHRAPQHLTLHSFPTRRSSDLNFQGCITMPIAQVMRPPVRKLMRRGEMFEKSLAGETTLAATLTLRVAISRSEEHTSELQSRVDLVCRLLLEKKKKQTIANQKT